MADAPRLAAIAVAVGLFDMVGNACYVLATQAGRLDVAATLSSLYPVTTILLAVAFLGERVTRSHASGIAGHRGDRADQRRLRWLAGPIG